MCIFFQNQNNVQEGKTFFDLATLNVIWRMATGQRFQYEDENAKEMIYFIEKFTMEKFLGIMGGVPNAKHLPYLRLLSFTSLIVDFYEDIYTQTLI